MNVKRIIAKRRYRINRLIVVTLGIHFLICNNLSAGLDDMPVGARSMGMGATYVALANTADALFLNPGGLSQITGTAVSLFYQKPFGLEDLNFGTATVSFPVWRTRLNLGFLTLGNNLYKEQVVRFGYSRNYKEKIYYGGSISYQSIQIDGYGSAGTLGLDIGLVLPLTEQLSLGFVAKNINRPNIGQSEEKLPQTFTTGLSLNPHPKLILNLEIFKDVRFKQEVRFGAEIQVFENLALRTGAGNNPNSFSAGVGITVKQFTIDYALFTHNDLGLTHQMSFSIHFGKRKVGKGIAQEQPVVAETDKKKPSRRVRGKKANRAPQIVKINSATAEELKTLPGIGETLAARIINYRKENGLFQKIEDLLGVPGIGIKTFEKIKKYIVINFEESRQESVKF